MENFPNPITTSHAEAYMHPHFSIRRNHTGCRMISVYIWFAPPLALPKSGISLQYSQNHLS